MVQYHCKALLGPMRRSPYQRYAGPRLPPGEKGAYTMTDEDKVLTCPEGEKPLDRKVVGVTEEIHIPKYDRLDFGFPKGGATRWTLSIPAKPSVPNGIRLGLRVAPSS